MLAAARNRRPPPTARAVVEAITALQNWAEGHTTTTSTDQTPSLSHFPAFHILNDTRPLPQENVVAYRNRISNTLRTSFSALQTHTNRVSQMVDDHLHIEMDPHIRNLVRDQLSTFRSSSDRFFSNVHGSMLTVAISLHSVHTADEGSREELINSLCCQLKIYLEPILMMFEASKAILPFLKQRQFEGDGSGGGPGDEGDPFGNPGKHDGDDNECVSEADDSSEFNEFSESILATWCELKKMELKLLTSGDKDLWLDAIRMASCAGYAFLFIKSLIPSSDINRG